MSEIKPCPLCGTKPYIRKYNAEEEDIVSCTVGGCPLSAGYITLSEWQKRPIEDALRAENEVLREACRVAEQTLRNFANGDLKGDAKVIAHNAAYRLFNLLQD